MLARVTHMRLLRKSNLHFPPLEPTHALHCMFFDNAMATTLWRSGIRMNARRGNAWTQCAAELQLVTLASAFGITKQRCSRRPVGVYARVCDLGGCDRGVHGVFLHGAAVWVEGQELTLIIVAAIIFPFVATPVAVSINASARPAVVVATAPGACALVIIALPRSSVVTVAVAAAQC